MERRGRRPASLGSSGDAEKSGAVPGLARCGLGADVALRRRGRAARAANALTAGVEIPKSTVFYPSCRRIKGGGAPLNGVDGMDSGWHLLHLESGD